MGNVVVKWWNLNRNCGGKMEGSTWEMWWQNGGINMGNEVKN